MKYILLIKRHGLHWFPALSSACSLMYQYCYPFISCYYRSLWYSGNPWHGGRFLTRITMQKPMKTPLVLDKLHSQGDFFIEKIKAALDQKIRKRYHGSIV